MTKNTIILSMCLIIIFTFLINYTSVFAANPSCTTPFKTVEEAVICSGGTYGVINTNDPDATNNFVQTVFDQGLTNNDGSGNCWSMNIRPSIKISCGLSVNKDAYYYYEGKKGEKVTITVSAKNFTPEIDISDANGTMEFFDNKQKQNFLTVTKTLPYTGKYTFEVKTRYYTETNEGEPFTVNLTSDKTNTQPDIRKDNLVAGKKYSVYELLNFNQSKVTRNFLTDAFVTNIYKEPYCPSDAYSCPISLSPNITIADVCVLANMANACQGKKSDTILQLDFEKKYDFKIAKQYKFEVVVVNTSNTNIPQNKFTLISVKEIVNSNVNNNELDSSGTLIEGEFYKISELNNIKPTNLKLSKLFKSEGYVIEKIDYPNGCPKCPTGVMCDIYCPNQATFSESKLYEKEIARVGMMQAVLTKESSTNAGSLTLNAKYILTVKVSNTWQDANPRNVFEIVNIKPMEDDFFATTSQQAAKISVFTKLGNWFFGLFK